MTIKTILAEISGNATDDAVLEGAWAVAETHGAHITVLHLKRDQLAPTWDPGMVDYTPVVELLQDEAKKHEATAKKRFEAWRARHRLAIKAEPPGSRRPTVAFHVESDLMSNFLTDAGRVSDLTVMLRPEISPADTSTDFETSLFETGRPVLLVPGKLDGRLYQNVMVAWDGSLEAARAVALAMPLLEQAEKVGVFTGGDQPDRADGRAAAALVTHLKWHGIAARVATTNPRAKSVGEDLLDSCRKSKASLLVMGAYTHSRLRQIVLGGVTRHVLANAKLPLLMTH
jgi:nucleotide-binding universal stress UspA family protein